MTQIAPPASNPELPIVFGTGSAFGSESRLQPHPFNPAESLATDETPMEHGLGTENCFFRPRFYPSPANNQFDLAIRGFQRFLICVYSVFHPWPIALTRLDMVSNIAGYFRLFQVISGYLTLLGGKIICIWSKINSPAVACAVGRDSRRATPIFNPILPEINPIQPYSTLFNPQYFFDTRLPVWMPASRRHESETMR